MTQPINPPGSTSEQLPAEVLGLLDLPPYLSTACQTAAAVEDANINTSGTRLALAEHGGRLHQRCRLNQKFTGQLCVCRCHRGGGHS